VALQRRHDAAGHDGIGGDALVLEPLVEADREGFARGRNLDKIGQNSADTSELFFNDVRVPMTNCLGEENMGFIYLMSQLPQERLSIALSAQAGAQRAFDEAVKFVKDRKAFGKTVWDFQNTKFVLAGLKTELQVGWAHVDWALQKLIEGKLTAAEASAAKLWHTELQGRVCDEALQLHGGYGYLAEYGIEKIVRDLRVHQILEGTNEIMRMIVARHLLGTR
jgi:alkylation response protein AidB-like acyl-CoA dehydrogenase